MKKGGIFLFMFLLSLFYPLISFAVDEGCVVDQGVCINEFMPYPSSGEEWVELVNISSTDKDIGGWIIRDNTASNHYDIPAGTTIIAGQVLLVTKDIGFNNASADSVRLFDSDAALLDQYSYSVDPDEGKSYGRENNDGVSDWIVFDIPSPGELNPVEEEPPPVVYSTKIYLNEVFPSPSSGDEWVEIANGDTVAVNLEGWTIEDTVGTVKTYTIGDVEIDPDGFKVFYKSDTGITLNNTGDGVVLKNPNGDIVDQCEYPSTSSDKSWSRKEEGVDDWTSDWPASLGASNIASANRYPIANAGSNIVNARTNEALNFNGSASSDSDGTIISYEWNFGDGSISSGVQATHSYSTIGTYQVSLIVHDDEGASASNSITVTVVAGEISYQNQYSANIKITEILPNPVGSDTEGEYIKIYNFGDQDVNLKNWSLDDEDGGSKPFKIDYDLIIKPKTIATFYAADTKISLNNTGDHARLFDPDNKIMDDVTYSGPIIEGAVYSLENGQWAWKNNIPESVEPAVESEGPAQPDPKVIATEAPIKPVLLPAAKIPDIKKIEITEPPIINSQKLTTKNKIPEVQNIGEIITSSGTLISSVGEEAEPVIQQDYNVSKTQNSTKRLYQKPLVVLPLMALSFLLIIKTLLRPEDWEKIYKKLFENDTEAKDSFENLFK